jgi:hypothetical protein
MSTSDLRDQRAGATLPPMEPTSDKKAVREQRRAERSQAAARRIWQQGESTGDAERDAAAAKQVWDGWASQARAHLDAKRTVYIAWINLGHTSAGYLSGPARQHGVSDPAWIIQAIESAGWALADTGYVYQTIRERSHMLTDSAQIEGNILGIYTFRPAT